MDPTTWGAPYPVVLGAFFLLALVRSNATYWAGRLVAAGVHRTRAARLMDSAGYQRATRRLNRWGGPAVTVSFLTIGVQTLVNLAAGATRMPLTSYLPASVLGSTLWAFLYATVGFAGFEALGQLSAISPAAAWSLGGVAVAGLAWFIVRQYRRRTS